MLKNVYRLSNLDTKNEVDRIGMFDGCSSLFSPDNPYYEESFNKSDTIDIVLLGFSKYKLVSSKITFNIYFYPYKSFELPQFLNLSILIIYNTTLRLLQEQML